MITSQFAHQGHIGDSSIILIHQLAHWQIALTIFFALGVPILLFVLLVGREKEQK